MSDELDTVISRIRKLMALTAARGASEAEAALAADHVQRLLAEHNLSMAAIEKSGASSGEHGRRVKEEGVGSRQVYKWQRTLMKAVAGLNFCRAFERFQDRGWGRPATFDGYDLIGRVDNVASTKVMFEYLLQTIERLARDDVKDPSQYFTRYAHSFKEGCADRLVERLEEQQRQIVEEQEAKAKEDAVRSKHPGAASSNLPAVILRDVIQSEQDLNNDFMQDLAPGTTARNRAEQEARRAAERAARERKESELIKAGYPADVAYYMSLGWSEQRAYEMTQPSKPQKPETEAQRRRRERSNEAWEERQRRREQREYDRLDQGAYRKGQRAGADVSLHRQVDRNQRGRLT